MKVLLLNQFFYPDHSATAQIATDLAEDLAASGIQVTALASRGSYLGGKPLAARDEYAGIQIIRAPATSFGKRSLIHRGIDYASFYATAAGMLTQIPRHDVVLALTTPPLIAAVGLVAKAMKGSKVVYWVQDLYPEIAVAFDALQEQSAMAKTMAALSRTVLSRADRVVTLGEAMRERCIRAGAVRDRTFVIPNWADEETVRPVPHASNPLRADLAQGAEVLVMYSGNMGRGHDIATLLDAADRLRDRSDIQFVFIGDGAKRADVEGASRRLPNVRLAGYQPRNQLSNSLSAGDLHLIALSAELEGLMEPSKLYGIMAAGRPSLFVGPRRSEVATTLVREGCGRVHSNGDAAGLAASIVELADDPTLREAVGQRARMAFERGFTRSHATIQFRELLGSLC